jgi:hypothetical protein
MDVKRGKQKVPIHYTASVDGYKYFQQAYKKPEIKQKLYTEIHKEINEEVFKMMRTHNFIYHIPCRLGKISIRKFKPKVRILEDGSVNWRDLKVDYKATWDYWRQKYPGKTDKEILEIPNKAKMYHHNAHTHGYRYKHKWDKGAANFNGKTCMHFKPVRQVSRDLNTWLRSLDSLHVDYFE